MMETFQKPLEEVGKEYEKKLHEAYNDIGKSHLRLIQRKSYLCAANCCDDATGSFDKLQNCVDKCTNPVNTAQQYLQNEFQDFHTRLQRCLTGCSDKVKEKMDLEKTNEFTDKHKTVFEDCGRTCFSRHTELLPSIIFKVKATLDKNAGL